VLNRRRFLAAAGGVIAAAACRPRLAESSGAVLVEGRRERLDRIGIQLYAVRREVQRDMAGTLERLAQIGYREVEFAGYFGRTPAETRALLDRFGLAAPSTHVGYDLVSTGLERVLDDAAARGHSYVTVPWLPPDARRSVTTWREVAERFNRAGEAARARGLSFAYHNHDFEFVRTGDAVPFDLLLEHTDPAAVSFQMDVFWLVKGGADPLAYLREHPDRFTMLHIKDSSGPPAHTQVDVGAGTIDYAAILRLDASQRRVIRHVFVEHDQPPDAMAFAKASYDYLRKLEF
jgi:sugar phosphate isomerase/epimerase